MQSLKSIFHNLGFKLSFLVFITVLTMVQINVKAQTIFTSTGTYTVPTGVTELKVECWGAGGGGSTRTSNGTYYGGGGGGGAYAMSIVTVTPGNNYNITVGTGGSANTAGGNSTFNSTSVKAVGGSGATNNSATGASGGLASSCTGTTKYSGGNGANGGTAGYSGGGGGGAGSSGNGSNASGGTAGTGTSLYGGNGGSGVAPGNNGSNGNSYGGGGSGSATNSNTNRTGGSGANGLVMVTPVTWIEVNSSGGTSLKYYSTLKSAFDAINAGTHTGTITIKINASTTETSSAVLNASGTGSASFTSLNIYPTVSGLSVSGSLASALIQFNGADNVTFDGRVNLSGNADLTIANTSTSSGARTVDFVNSATTNYLQYCYIKGAGTSATQGTINFATASSGSGNDGNYIQYCYISGVNSTDRPTNAIYSAGSSGYENSENFIRNNEIYDFLNKSLASNGLYISNYSNAFTITGNSFYETASFVPTASVEYSAIRISNTSGTDFTVSDNYIGGSAASCDGIWTKTNAFNNTFIALYLSLGSTNNTIQNNTIQNFNYANAGSAVWYGIYVADGSVNIGTATGNKIGASTATGSITFTSGATGASFNGIYIASSGTVNCSKNTVGSITTAASNAAYANHFYGIYKTATSGSTFITQNIIGSMETSNSINAGSTATGNSQYLYGIYVAGSGTNTISENTIYNLTNGTTETTLSSRTKGIFSNGGSNVIQKNDVSKLKTGGLSNGANYDNASIMGICLISTVANQDISENKVNNLETTATGKIEMYGIYYNGAASGTNTVLKNLVHTFIIPSGGSTGSYLHGISLYAGNYTAANNIVYLGNNIAVGCSLWGIWTGSTNNIKVYYNTIYLSGTATSGSSNSFAFRSLNCPASADIRNNIFWDARVNSPSSITHYAIYLNCTTNLTLNYNDYKYALSFGVIAGTTYTTLDSWKSVAYDNNSLSTDPLIVNLGGTLAVDYQTGIQLTGTALSDITTDYNGISRTTPTMGAWEFFSNPVEVWKNDILQNSYATLKGAFDKVNDGTHTGSLVIKLKGNTTETASAKLNASGTGSANYSKILIYPAREGVKVSGNINEPLVDLSGADNIIFDGRLNGSGDTHQISFINNSTSSVSGTCTFRFINTAANDTIRYCKVKGATTDVTGGVIFFSTASTGSGNSGNMILSDSITAISTSTRPLNMIYSSGSSGHENTGNIISNNFIYNFINPSADANGINIASNSTDFSILGNSLFETTSVTPGSSVSYSAIKINNTSGGNFTVSSNYIGGNSPLAAGLLTKNSGVGNVFYGIYISSGSVASSVQGNTIKNISWNNTGNSDWSGIYIGAGVVNTGTVTGNTIGSSTGTGSITVTNSTSGGTFYGININSAETVDCENNIIGAITATNSASNATNFTGINKTAVAGTTTISKNAIGSSVTTNSINASGTSTGNVQTVYGVKSSGTGDVTINENLIANLNNATTNSTTSTQGCINGIAVTAGSNNTVSKNTVRNLSIANANTTTNGTASAIGINLSGAGTTRSVTENSIYSISNTFSNFAGNIYGLYFEGTSSSANTIDRNFIHSISTPNNSTSNSTLLNGIRIYSGLNTVSNNIIFLGSTAIRNNIYGIYDQGTSSNNINVYFNTVYVAGSEPGTSVSACLYSNANTNTRNFKNNIFSNARTSTTGQNYCMYYNYGTSTNLTVNYNDYYTTTGTYRHYGRYNSTNYNSIPFISGQDANSVTTNPAFNSAGSTLATDYKVATTLAGTSGTGITIDYGNNGRPSSNPTMGAWETNSNKWIGTTSTNWNTTTNWTGNTVPPSDANIEFYSSPVNNLVVQNDVSVGSIINATSYKVVVNGKKLTVKGNLTFSNGATVDARYTGSEVSFNGETAQTIPSGAFYNDTVYNLTINNSNNVTLNGTLKLTGSINTLNGFLDADSNSPTFNFSGSGVQNIEDSVFLNNKAYNLTINNAAGVVLNTDFLVSNNLTINSGKSLTVSLSKLLKVNGTVTNNADATGLLIKSSSSSANGSFVFFNTSTNPVLATVEMYSKAFAATYALNTSTNRWTYSNYKWQYFGVPFKSIVKSNYDCYYDVYNASNVIIGYTKVSNVRKWDESGTTVANHWVTVPSTDSLYAFKGYEITQTDDKTYTTSGVLYNSNYASGQLPYTSSALYPGQSVLSNSYAAAIDISQINFGSDTEWTVYLYNSGSYDDWFNNSGESTTGTSPGQYVAVPKYLAGTGGLPGQIPSMQGFLVKATSSSPNATINIPYSAAAGKNTEMQRITHIQPDRLPMTIIQVKSVNEHDIMWLVTNPDCSQNYDNGWDGYKTLVSSTAQIFASDSAGLLQTDVLKEINKTKIGFYPGADSIYTLSFQHLNSEDTYPHLYLVDLKNDSTIEITDDGTEYTFKSLSGDTLVDRFLILSKLDTATTITANKFVDQNDPIKIYSADNKLYVNNNSVYKCQLTLYSADGIVVLQQIFDSETQNCIPLKLPVGTYFAKGESGHQKYIARFIVR